MDNYAAITLHVSKIMAALPEYASNHVAKVEIVVRTKIISSDSSSNPKLNLDQNKKTLKANCQEGLVNMNSP